MPGGAWLMLVLFMALLLAGCLHLLSASGHFPAEHRAEQFRGGCGRLLLFGSMVLVVACLVIGLVAVWRAVPWYAVVIGGGLAVLAAPLALRPFADSFVDGRASLAVFSAVTALMTLIMLGLIAAM